MRAATQEGDLVSVSAWGWPIEEAARLREDSGITPYFDRVLVESPELYAEYLVGLHRSGQLRWDLSPVSEAPPFFVYKDDEGTLRTLFDGRLVNFDFVDPPGVRLLSAEGVSKLEIPQHHDLYSSGYDFDNFFIIKRWIFIALRDKEYFPEFQDLELSRGESRFGAPRWMANVAF